MSKQMICSRATAEQIEALWPSWEWPQGEYLQDHHKHWLNNHCAQYWHNVQRTLYFQQESDLDAWRVVYSQQPKLTHNVWLGNMNYVDRHARELWCAQEWGPDLFRGKCWPQGTWTYVYVPKVGYCMQFAHEEQAVQFSLSWSHT